MQEEMFKDLFPPALLRDKFELRRRVDHFRQQTASQGQGHIAAALEKWLATQLQTVTQKESADMSTVYTASTAPEVIYDSYESCKTAAAGKFKNSEFPEALRLYNSALKFSATDEHTALLHSNMALCHLKMERFNAVIECATAALHLDPRHAKSLYRRASAYMKLGGQDERAADDLRLAAELEPHDKLIAELLRKCTECRPQQHAERLSFSDSIQLGGGHADYTGYLRQRRGLPPYKAPQKNTTND